MDYLLQFLKRYYLIGILPITLMLALLVYQNMPDLFSFEEDAILPVSETHNNKLAVEIINIHESHKQSPKQNLYLKHATSTQAE